MSSILVCNMLKYIKKHKNKKLITKMKIITEIDQIKRTQKQ